MAKPVRVGELEGAVMNVVWATPDGVTAREIVSALPGPELAITTVLTVLDRLQRKGMVERERVGRAHRYTAARSREDFLSALMSDALDSTDDRGAVLARFLGAMRPDDTDTLRKLLRRRTAGGG
jgi:predicted transcriptional regulator